MKESNKRLKTKRTIENAMVQLLMEQPFDQISTVKLAPLNWQKKLELVALVFILITKISMI